MLATVVLALLAASAGVAAPTSASSSSSTISSSSSSSSSTSRPATLSADAYTSQKWIDGYKKAQRAVAGMTLAEKVKFTDLRADADLNGCSGLTFPISSANISQGICFSDAPTGVQSRYSTQFPTEVTTGGTWDKRLISARAEAMGQEFAAVGVHAGLSIVAGPMGRSPYGGRNWENFSPDVYLTGEATKLSVAAFQKSGVVGLVKHFFGNEQEWLRVGIAQGGYLGRQENLTIDAHISAATARELYAWPFAEAVREGAGAVMCSYNKVNGTLACENDAVLNGLLKQELGFGGYVLSDWGAVWNTDASALNGTDFVEDSREESNPWGPTLGDAIANGTLPDTIIDDKLLRILTPYYALEQASLPSVDMSRRVTTESHEKIVRDVSEGSITLLKNARSANDARGLPLVKPKDLILVGSAAAPARFGMLNNLAYIFYYTDETDLRGFAPGGFGSGSSPSPYAIDPLTGIRARGRKDGVIVDGYYSDDPMEGYSNSHLADYGNVSFLDTKLDFASSTIVFVSAIAMEGYDRHDLKLANGGDELISYVAERHNDTIVVITAPGPVDMSAWIDHANITSVLITYYPTTEAGNGIASVLFGDVNPSGRLPFTIAKNVEDYPDAIYNGSVAVNPVTNFTEGVFIDYKYFDAKNITPLYEFGYGMSYTDFSFSDVKISSTKRVSPAPVRETNEKLFIKDQLTSGLYDVVYTVKATVKNTGSVDGAEVAQLYLTFPDSTPRAMPIRSLRGFEKPFLKAGRSKTVSFELRNKDLAYYSVIKGGWVVPEGEFKVSVGSSSRKLSLTSSFTH
ncbi:hypothetical protein JCM11641_005685 [Rhodosporidiobolus odoratus]